MPAHRWVASALDGLRSLPSEVENSPIRLGTGLLLGALAATMAFRLYLLIAYDFPVNDGALFLEFVRAAAAVFPWLPDQVEYNGLALPFAYPPLAFWLGALLTKLGFDSLAVLRTMPILMNMAYVLLFALLLLKSGHSRLFTALAISFFSVRFLSFEWLLMGGGLTRGLGSIFLMLTLLAVTVPDRTRQSAPARLRMALAGAAVAGAILSHLEWGMLAAASVVLSRALGSRNVKDFIISCALAGITAFALVSPWLLFVHQAHGLEPFLAAASTGGWSPKFIVVRLLEVALVPPTLNPFVLLGALVLLVKRQWFWIGFILLCVVLTPRHAPTPLTLPIAVFAAQGILSAYALAARFVDSRKLLTGSAAVVVAVLLCYGTYRTYLQAPRDFRVLPQEMRQAMVWVAKNHPGARFAIVNDRAWQIDSTGEWFPTLASARSITTVQGREWNGEHNRWDKMSLALRASGSCSELEANLRPYGSYDFVWVETMQKCFASPRYQPVFRNERVSIYRTQSYDRRPERL